MKRTSKNNLLISLRKKYKNFRKSIKISTILFLCRIEELLNDLSAIDAAEDKVYNLETKVAMMSAEVKRLGEMV
jgi:hypothetical protein